MFLAKSNTLKYAGYYDGKHHFLGTISDEHVIVSEAKYLDIPRSMVFIFTLNGEVLPTHSTSRKFDQNVIISVLNEFHSKM